MFMITKTSLEKPEELSLMIFWLQKEQQIETTKKFNWNLRENAVAPAKSIWPLELYSTEPSSNFKNVLQAVSLMRIGKTLTKKKKKCKIFWNICSKTIIFKVMKGTSYKIKKIK